MLCSLCHDTSQITGQPSQPNRWLQTHKLLLQTAWLVIPMQGFSTWIQWNPWVPWQICWGSTRDCDRNFRCVPKKKSPTLWDWTGYHQIRKPSATQITRPHTFSTLYIYYYFQHGRGLSLLDKLKEKQFFVTTWLYLWCWREGGGGAMEAEVTASGRCPHEEKTRSGSKYLSTREICMGY